MLQYPKIKKSISEIWNRKIWKNLGNFIKAYSSLSLNSNYLSSLSCQLAIPSSIWGTPICSYAVENCLCVLLLIIIQNSVSCHQNSQISDTFLRRKLLSEFIKIQNKPPWKCTSLQSIKTNLETNFLTFCLINQISNTWVRIGHRNAFSFISKIRIM